MPTVRRATADDLDVLVPLFDAYRSFYAQTPEPERARAFLGERLQRGDSVILLAQLDDGEAVGFTQLYPMFSSVCTARVWVLNDLFVGVSARRRKLARALLQAAEDFASADGALRLELETTPNNRPAQALYRAMGWQAYNGTLRFHRALTAV